MGIAKDPPKLKSAKIKLYSNQFEVHETNGISVPKNSGIWKGTPEEVLAGFTVWIERYMNLRKRVPLVIEIREEGQVILSPGSTAKS